MSCKVEGTEVRLSLVWGDIEPYSLPLLASYQVGCSLRTLLRSQILGFLVKFRIFIFCLLGWLGHLQCEMWESSMLSVLCCHSQFNFKPQPRAVTFVVTSFMNMRWAFKVIHVVHTNGLWTLSLLYNCLIPFLLSQSCA